MAKLNQARRDLIAKLRRKGYTYAEIGASFDPPVSRQAVQDIARKIPREVLDKLHRSAYK